MPWLTAAAGRDEMDSWKLIYDFEYGRMCGVL
jgi:hypothetical protein